MRLVAGIALINQGLTRLQAVPPIEPLTLGAAAIVGGLLLIAGFWTPLSGSLVALLELWLAIAQSGDRLANTLLATIGVVLALVGPGAWSVDARLYGWKRIDVGKRKRDT
ncbi:MAG TPA: hypothetical protein VKE51_41700 [Vicinamibacterales bacterium]|nr:hypothetical protein [Vicinamibacterales bacterium]